VAECLQADQAVCPVECLLAAEWTITKHFSLFSFFYNDSHKNMSSKDMFLKKEKILKMRKKNVSKKS
jgi:hypothetical protein